MLEFFSGETLKAVIFLIFGLALLYGATSSNKRGKKKSGGTKAFFLLCVLISLTVPFIEATIAQSDAKSNLTNFVNGSRFICIESSDKKYSVSKKEKWSIKSIYFSKDSLLIRADKCEEF